MILSLSVAHSFVPKFVRSFVRAFVTVGSFACAFVSVRSFVRAFVFVGSFFFLRSCLFVCLLVCSLPFVRLLLVCRVGLLLYTYPITFPFVHQWKDSEQRKTRIASLRQRQRHLKEEFSAAKNRLLDEHQRWSFGRKFSL